MGIGWSIIVLLISFNVTTAHIGVDVHAMSAHEGQIYIGGKHSTICRINPDKISVTPPECKSLGYYLITSMAFYGDKGIAVGERARIYLSQDGGNSWEDVSPQGIKYHLLDVEWIDSKRAMAVGDWGTILWSDDGGKTWRERSLKKKYSPAEWSIPVLASDLKDSGSGRVYKKGEQISLDLAQKLTREGVDVWIRRDIILNDVLKVFPDEVVVTGENGKVFTINIDTWEVREISLLNSEGGDSLLDTVPTLFFITGAGDMWLVGGSGGSVFYARSFTGPYSRVSFPWKQADTVFSGSMNGDTICLAGLYGTLLFSFDRGETWKKYVSEETRIKWFRRAIATEDGTCMFGGEGGLLLIISR